MMDFSYGFIPFFGFGLIFMILFWGLILFGVVAFVKWAMGVNGNGQAKQMEGKSAMDILSERFARSEISKEEFEEKKKVLKA